MKYLKHTGSALISSSERAFTLIEVLVVVTVAGFIGAALVGSFVQSQGFFMTESAKISQGLNLNDAVNQINEAVRSTSAIASVNPIGTPQFTTDQDTLILETPAVDSSGNVINQTFDYIVINIEGTDPKRIRKKVFPGNQSARVPEDRIISNNVSSLSFVYKDQNGNIVSPGAASKVSYIINLSEKAGKANKVSSASSEISLRNN